MHARPSMSINTQVGAIQRHCALLSHVALRGNCLSIIKFIPGRGRKWGMPWCLGRCRIYELRPRGLVGWEKWVTSSEEAGCWLLDLASCTVSALIFESHLTLVFFFYFMGCNFLHLQLGTTSREVNAFFLRKKEGGQEKGQRMEGGTEV